MRTRHASLLAAAAFAAFALPAQAQDGPPPPLPALDAQAGTYDGKWTGEWEDAGTYRGVWTGTYTGLDGEPVETQYRGVFHGDGYFVPDDGPALIRDQRRGWREDGWRKPPHPPRFDQDPGMRPGSRPQSGPGRPLGYTPQQRAAWLEQCRAVYLRNDRQRGNGAVIGGLLGAAVGGFAGNRIADDDRLLGTVIGAGVGGVAGAAIGDASDRGSRRNRAAAAMDACEDYLLRYERSYAAAGYRSAPGYGPVKWVRVPIIREPRRECDWPKVIREEVVEKPARRLPPTKLAPVKQPEPTKQKPVKTQKIQSIK